MTSTPAAPHIDNWVHVPATRSDKACRVTDDGLVVPTVGVRRIDGDHDPHIDTTAESGPVIELSVVAPDSGSADAHLDPNSAHNVAGAIHTALTPLAPSPNPIETTGGRIVHVQPDGQSVALLVARSGGLVSVHPTRDQASAIASHLETLARQ